MRNSFADYKFDTNEKFVSGIARTGSKESSKIVGFYVSNFGQNSDYLYQARDIDSVPNADLNVLFPPGWFLSGIEHYQKSTRGGSVEEEQIHYIITDGYGKLVGYIHRQQHPLGGNSPETVESESKFACTSGEYLTQQNHQVNLTNQVRTVIHDYKCSAGKPRPIPASIVGVSNPIIHQSSTPSNRWAFLENPAIIFFIVVCAIVLMSSFSTVLGTAGNVVGGTMTEGGDLVDNMIASSGGIASDMVGDASDMVGDMISGAGRMLGGAIGRTTNMVGGAIGGTAGLIGGTICGTSQTIGGAMDSIVGDSLHTITGGMINV
jgi:hypothetical protein